MTKKSQESKVFCCRLLVWEMNILKFKSSVRAVGHLVLSYHDASHCGYQLLPQITKVAVITLPLKIETFNENQTPLTLGPFSTLDVVGHIG